jgi:hypothetical protein
MAQNNIPQIQVSKIHSIKTLTVSLVRANPASSITKPACIPNTRKAATNVQTVLMEFIMDVSCAENLSCALATVPIKAGKNFIEKSMIIKPMILPPKIAIPYFHFSDLVS